MIRPGRPSSGSAALLLVTLLLAAPGRAQRRGPAKNGRSGRQALERCPNGVTLGLSRDRAAQGGLLELTIGGGRPVSDLKGEWAGTALPLWEEAGNLHHGLLGIDLERAPGNYRVDLSGKFANGETLTCSATVDVTAGKFAIERLKVAPGFVELSPGDEARAAKESERLHHILAAITPERLWTGRFRFPLAGKHTGHNFGRRRVLNGEPRSPHTGLDIPAPAGTPIHAAQGGRVVLAANFFFSGNTVLLDHGLGVYTFYGHMKRIEVKEGERVKVGATLGLVGVTRRAPGPPLHWSLIVDGARVNPLGIVRLPLR
jgi:murein DD-endopeptidase MepM/ murein hydrolase activator NlpD